jgi:hypothetical protein
MSVPQAFPGNWSTGNNEADRPVVDLPESIGSPEDAPATDVKAGNSASALMKRILVALGVPAGTGDAIVNTAPPWLRRPRPNSGRHGRRAGHGPRGGKFSDSPPQGHLCGAGASGMSKVFRNQLRRP